MIRRTAPETIKFKGGFDTFYTDVYFDIICQKFS